MPFGDVTTEFNVTDKKGLTFGTIIKIINHKLFRVFFYLSFFFNLYLIVKSLKSPIICLVFGIVEI